MDTFDDPELGRGSGSALSPVVLGFAGACTVVATLVSAGTIYTHVKNYRKPLLQRMVIRIILMVPIYAISSLIALFSLDAAFFIDAVRDIYEAFVIYCFFQLLLGYLGGERSLLILLHGREPKRPVFPVNIFKREIDVSDPYTFLFLKRGILQYVQIKPILAVATIILKATGKFNEGNLKANSGYLYISIIYNTSICLALYCLAMFWVCVNDDLQAFRPMPKFLCVKGILFFSFWQSLFISVLVAAGLITSLGPYTDSEHISLAITDCLICIEMPIFAFSHWYAFSHIDYIDRSLQYAARMRVGHALRDAFGAKDVVEDSKSTLRAEGLNYREFEPADGFVHQGAGRDRRIRAGLRYSKAAKKKYWLPQHVQDTEPVGRVDRVVNKAARKVLGTPPDEVYAPLLGDEAEDVIHLAPDLTGEEEREIEAAGEVLSESSGSGFELPFGVPNTRDDALFVEARRYIFGDYHYPVIDVSSESARREMWEEEERILRDERGAYFSPVRGGGLRRYGATDTAGTNARTPILEAPTYSRRHSGASSAGVNDRLVDFDDNRVPDSESNGVRLKWTHGAHLHPRSSVPSGSGSRNRKGSAAAASSSPIARGRSTEPVDEGYVSPSSSNPSIPTTPSMQPSPSITSPPPSNASPPPKARNSPDAVDLVVADEEVAEQEMQRERRRGEPAVRGSGLRRVYRRGYDNESSNVDTASPIPIQEAEEERARVEGAHVTSVLSPTNDDGELTIEVPQHTVARVMTPPPHARLYDIGDDEDNPWA